MDDEDQYKKLAQKKIRGEPSDDPIDQNIDRLREKLLEQSPQKQRSEYVRKAVEWCMDPTVEREVKQATQTIKSMVKSQLYL